jgi:hypothetical protein
MTTIKKAPTPGGNNLNETLYEVNKFSPNSNFDNIGIEDLNTDTEETLKQINEAKECKGLFLVKTATRWIEQAKKRPSPKMLFSEFWHEGEKYFICSKWE